MDRGVSEGLSDRAAEWFRRLLAREASHRATVMVRLTVNPATGAVQSAGVELSTLNDTEGARCVAEEVGRMVSIPALRSTATSVQVRVPVTLLSE